jgi:hypothetical protein
MVGRSETPEGIESGAAQAAQWEIASSASPRVRGPYAPIETTTITIAKAMNPNTAFTPPLFSSNATTSPDSAADRRLHDYTNPTARERIRVGNSSDW